MPRMIATAFVCGLATALTIAVAIAQDSDAAVQTSADDAADATRIRASITIAAPPAIVWAVLSDCARMPAIVPNVESCRVVERDPKGHWDVRENVMNPALLPRIRTVMRNTLEPGKRFAFKLVSGDLRRSEGEWTLEPSGKSTRLTYDALVAPNFFAPRFMIEQAIQTDFPNVLRAIERASLEDAAAMPAAKPEVKKR
ncbi:MAG: SRPBCC family protein [Pseudolabrys sp.]|nr:SRPBCC family protein [Pseudolabrys sp.]